MGFYFSLYVGPVQITRCRERGLVGVKICPAVSIGRDEGSLEHHWTPDCMDSYNLLYIDEN